jgi:hypothetical protein
MEKGITLRQHDNLVRSPKHQQQRLCQLLEASIRPTWVEDENVREHRQYEPVLSFPSVTKIKIKIHETIYGLLYGLIPNH